MDKGQKRQSDGKGPYGKKSKLDDKIKEYNTALLRLVEFSDSENSGGEGAGAASTQTMDINNSAALQLHLNAKDEGLTMKRQPEKWQFKCTKCNCEFSYCLNLPCTTKNHSSPKTIPLTCGSCQHNLERILEIEVQEKIKLQISRSLGNHYVQSQESQSTGQTRFRVDAEELQALGQQGNSFMEPEEFQIPEELVRDIFEMAEVQMPEDSVRLSTETQEFHAADEFGNSFMQPERLPVVGQFGDRSVQPPEFLTVGQSESQFVEAQELQMPSQLEIEVSENFGSQMPSRPGSPFTGSEEFQTLGELGNHLVQPQTPQVTESLESRILQPHVSPVQGSSETFWQFGKVSSNIERSPTSEQSDCCFREEQEENDQVSSTSGQHENLLGETNAPGASGTEPGLIRYMSQEDVIKDILVCLLDRCKFLKLRNAFSTIKLYNGHVTHYHSGKTDPYLIIICSFCGKYVFQKNMENHLKRCKE